MKRFKNILLYAGSETDNKTALEYAVSLSRKNGAALKIVDVIKGESRYTPILPESIRNLNLHDILHSERLEELERLAYPYRNTGIPIKVKVLSGTPFIEIIREIARKEHDILITSPQDSDGLSETLFGTTSMHLMRKCPCPVWAIKPSNNNRFDRIMAAVDFDPLNKEADALNTKIMELASSLARLYESELHIVHVWDFLIRSAMIPKHTTDEMTGEVLTLHKSWLKELLAKQVPDLPENRVHLIKGEADIEIPGLAGELDADLIVMGTVSRTGIPGLFIGNTAEKILFRVNCSVLTVKPDGFTTPVDVS